MIHEHWLIFLLVVNFIVTALYFLWNLLRKRQRAGSYILRCIVMLLCPLLGILFFLVGWIFFRLFFHSEVDLADVVFSKERTETHLKADEDRERNLVPLEDAIAVTDRENTRILMMEIVRRDVREALSPIASALNSDDTEVAHYAASVLQEELDRLRTSIQQLYRQIRQLTEEEKDEDRELILSSARELEQVLYLLLRQHVLSPMEQRTNLGILEETDRIIRQYGSLHAYELEHVVLLLIETEQFEAAKEWAELSMEVYPKTLSSYTNLMRLYYQMGDGMRFREITETLRNSELPIDHKTMEMIRVFI